MMSHINTKQLKFSDIHGCNVFTKGNRTCCIGEYVRAQGQCITRAPLVQDNPFLLRLLGTGVVKLYAFPKKCEAIAWVRSKQPLPPVCRRIRVVNHGEYKVSIPKPGRCLLFETSRISQHFQRETFTMDTGPETTMAFDIEYGDIIVNLVSSDSGVSFDPSWCSSFLEISKAQGISSARLSHYNPTSLCCLDNVPLIAGSVFELEVTNSGTSMDSGSYIRVCVGKLINPYENKNGQIEWCGTPGHPLYKGKRILIKQESCERLFVRVLHGRLKIDRDEKSVTEIKCQPHFNLTLWFEIHKVSLKAWQTCDPAELRLEQPLIKIKLDDEDTPPTEPAPPPPLPPRPLPPRLTTPTRGPAVFQCGQKHECDHVHGVPCRYQESMQTFRDDCLSDSSTSNSMEANPHVLRLNYRLHNSVERKSRKDAGHPQFISVPVSVSDIKAAKQNLPNEIHIEWPSLITSNSHNAFMSSQATFKCSTAGEDQCESACQGAKGFPTKCQWENQKPPPRPARSRLTSFRKTGEETGAVLTDFRKRDGTSTIPLRELQRHRCASPRGAGESRYKPACPFPRGTKATVPFDRCADVHRNAMCNEWVQKTNNYLSCWSSPEKDDIKTMPPVHNHCPSPHKYDVNVQPPVYSNWPRTQKGDIKAIPSVRNHWSSPEKGDMNSKHDHQSRERATLVNKKCKHIRQNGTGYLKGISDEPTSSLWIVASADADDDGGENESVKHDLDIQIDYVEGNLRCHSYNIDSIENLKESRNNSTQLGLSRGDVDDSKNHPTDSELRAGYSENKSSDFVHCTRPKLVSRCSIPFQSFCDGATNKESSEQEQSISESESTLCDSETIPKSTDSDFNVAGDIASDSCSNISDETTYPKDLAQEDNCQDQGVPDIPNKMLPKLCRQASVATYFLAGSFGPADHKQGVASDIIFDRNGNHIEHEPRDNYKNHDSQEESEQYNTETLLKTFTITNENDIELREQTSGLDPDCIRSRYPWKKTNRNIIESQVFNNSIAMLTPSPTVVFQDDSSSCFDAPLKRSETLKRNLDTSPRPSIRKDCGSKLNSMDFKDKNKVSNQEFVPHNDADDICDDQRRFGTLVGTLTIIPHPPLPTYYDS